MPTESWGPSRGGLLVVALFVLTAGCLLAASPAVADDPAEGELNISVEPTETDVEPGETTTYELVVEGAEEGIHAYDHLDVVIEDPTVAQFVDFHETAEDNADDDPFSHTAIEDGDGNEVEEGPVFSMQAALTGDVSFEGAEEIVIAEVDVEILGEVPSTTDLTIVENPEPEEIDEPQVAYNIDGDAYDVNALSNSDLTMPGAAGIELVPAETDLMPGETTTYEVVVDAEYGIQAYSGIEVAIENADTGTFVDFQETAEGLADAEPVSDSEIRDGDGNAAETGPVLWLEAELGDAAFEGGEVVIAEVEAEVTGPDASAVTVTGPMGLQDLQGITYDVTETTDSELEPIGVDVTGDGNPATDTTGDGLLNDVQGSGEFTIFDVQALFNNFDIDLVQDNVPLFDFNDDDQVAIFDVQALFNQLATES